jgi:tetratricopeptide (TPR) repeat protein
MKRARLMAGGGALLLIAGGALGWLYGTAGGQAWRLGRTRTEDLLAQSLSRPQDARLQRALAERYRAEGRFEEAATAFGALAALEPNTSEPLIAQGSALIRAGKAQDALPILEQAVARNANSADALAALGEAHYLAGNRTQAEENFAAALQTDAENGMALAGSAFVLADKHQFEKARARAQRAVETMPASSFAYTALGYVEAQSGRSAEGMAALRKAVEIDPKQGRAWGLLAEAQIRVARSAEDFARAAETLAKTDALLPASPLVPYHRGMLYLKQKQYTEAAAAFREALQRNPNYTEALYNLSLALAFAGQKQESDSVRAQYERARDYNREVGNLQIRIGRDPTNPDLWKKLLQIAETHNDPGRVELARQKLERLRGRR